ncbi:nitroreductase family deazaflavin-dependent oxidoreductase [Rathayibacter soli]|uniref:nitroreductase family deazaflavin-dependent oxidoreductase n=1 Tax=Rathayibacter soli TaxID=3144168 RepID=UPI0027E4A0BD|nr:nitroreductase family deazaflavin-dependent oxidoreductase [Glaciibacter superstes]
MSIRNQLTDVMMKSMNASHRALVAVTRGHVGWSMGSVTVVELHTIGRKSGKSRATMLNSPVHDHSRYCLVASKGGDDRHPQWYLNLLANPDVELTVREKTIPMRARKATPEERTELWPAIVASYHGYAEYQKKTTREIPVVICEPRQAA